MSTPADKTLPLFAVPKENVNVEWFVKFLTRRDWITAAEVLGEIRWPVTDSNKRWLRGLADASAGRIGSGQKGYKLVREMTGEEFHHTNNWLNHQAEEMKRRVLEMQREFYRRTPVEVGV